MSTASHNDNPAPLIEPSMTAAQRKPQPTETQLRWLARGLDQPGGKLPLFDDLGQKISERTVRSCLEHGWVEPWFANPIKPDWVICKLTDSGRALLISNDE